MEIMSWEYVYSDLTKQREARMEYKVRSIWFGIVAHNWQISPDSAFGIEETFDEEELDKKLPSEADKTMSIKQIPVSLSPSQSNEQVQPASSEPQAVTPPGSPAPQENGSTTTSVVEESEENNQQIEAVARNIVLDIVTNTTSVRNFHRFFSL